MLRFATPLSHKKMKLFVRSWKSRMILDELDELTELETKMFW